MHSPVTRSVLAWALRSAVLLIMAAAMTKLLPAVEPVGGKTAGEPALLRWKWSPDSEWVAEFHQQVTTDSTFGAKTLRLAIESRFTQRWLVRSVDAQGAATLQQSYTKIAVSVDMGMGNTIAFDTDRPANPMGESRRLADALQPLVGPTWTLVVSPRGEVLWNRRRKRKRRPSWRLKTASSSHSSPATAPLAWFGRPLCRSPKSP
jgi:hypothetical protein